MYQRILVPLDGSELAECSLDHLRKLVQECEISEVILLNALDPLPWVRAGVDFVGIKNIQFQQVQDYLAKIQSQLNAEGIKARSEIVEGIAVTAIVTYAKENAVDLIIISSHGRTGMKQWLFGSVALRVLHDSHVPVLLIRPESHQV